MPIIRVFPNLNMKKSKEHQTHTHKGILKRGGGGGFCGDGSLKLRRETTKRDN